MMIDKEDTGFVCKEPNMITPPENDDWRYSPNLHCLGEVPSIGDVSGFYYSIVFLAGLIIGLGIGAYVMIPRLC